MNKFMAYDDVMQSSNVKTFELNENDLNECLKSDHSNTIYLKLASQIESYIESLNMNINKTKSYTNIMRIGKDFGFIYNIFKIAILN